MKQWKTINYEFAVHLKELEENRNAQLNWFCLLKHFNYDLQLHKNSDPLEKKLAIKDESMT